jgi:hypothetical protein
MPDEWRAQMQLRAANQIIGREKRLHPNRRLKNLTLRIVHSAPGAPAAERSMPNGMLPIARSRAATAR